jgi:serine/threonine protein kinase
MSFDGPPASPGSGPLAQPSSLVGQIIDGRYRIIRKLGEGGMGEVFAAEHIHIEKRFAIKLLRPEIVSNPEAVTRFRQEARSSSSIGHRNIIAIEDFGQLADGRIYMCMELLNGAALNDMITQPMGLDRLLNILVQTGHGLAAAHAKGIIHRDMKPENIFVTIGPNGEDIPKLLDFGIAKVSGNDGQNHLTRTGTIFGTPFYMAPEQALGNPVDARTDIYAVGVIMYECFSGSLPFQGDSFMGILTQHITMEPEPVVQRAAKAGRQLPPGLAEVITRCMQKNPAHRFATMDELVNLLIQIYRGVVGPGMSTYMEAFPVMPSAAHPVQSTPVPMTGAVQIRNAYTPTVAATGPSGSVPVMSVTGGGAYPSGSVVMPRKSKLGPIIAVIAVLAVGGGVAAFVMVGNRNNTSGGGSGLGSQIASNDDRGSSHGIQDGPGHDASVVVAIERDAAAGSNSTIVAMDPDAGSNHAESGAGSGGAVEIRDGSNGGSNVVPPGEVVPVLLFTRSVGAFEVYENGVKVLDGPDTLPVPKGEKRVVVVKASGFKDKPLTVDTTKKKREFSLARIPVRDTGNGPTRVNAGSGSGRVVNAGSGSEHVVNAGSGSERVVTPPPAGPDCSSKIVESKNKACIKQYCAKHSDDDRCHME